MPGSETRSWVTYTHLLGEKDSCLGHVTHGGGRREGCSVNVCRINGQHTLTRVDSPPYLPMEVMPHWDHSTYRILLE